VNGGAIAMGHPLGCSGAKLSVQIFDEMRKRDLKNKHCIVTMCVGTGQGAAGVYEFLELESRDKNKRDKTGSWGGIILKS
jgi:acetyl-CoA acyltransferase